MLGGACICDATFDPVRLARLVEAERISFLPGTPTLFGGLLDNPARKDFDLRSLRICLVAGALVPIELVQRIQAELCEQVVVGYGLSELCAAISLTPQGAEPRRVAEWAGQVVEGVEVRVVDDTGNEVPQGEPGEILALSDCIMVGYLDDPAATADVIGPDGWLHTGDIGIVDDDDYLRITDRKKDMFIVGGFNAYPAEIERLLLLHPDVSQVAVLGVPDDRLGEVGVAFVVAKPGADPAPDAIIRWAREHLSNFKVPRQVIVVDELPMNASLKVQKHELRAQLRP
jgi:acyl-CoA synthetase (AMP-forming)/AMP-acid ligase II